MTTHSIHLVSLDDLEDNDSSGNATIPPGVTLTYDAHPIGVSCPTPFQHERLARGTEPPVVHVPPLSSRTTTARIEFEATDYETLDAAYEWDVL